MVPRRALAGAMLVLLLACALPVAAPVPALGASGNAGATQAYVQADLRLVNSAAGKIHLGESIISGVLAQVRRECPHSAAKSPQDPQSTDLSNEVIGTMVISAIRPVLGPIHQFLGSVSHLHWGSSAASRGVRSYVGQLKAMAGLSVPKLCADVRGWAASGYKTLTADTVSFDRVFVPSWVAVGAIPGALSAFESGATRGLARQAGRRESQLADFEAREVERWGDIMNVLELNP
ncbi:MAG TPA: hypothetical protein VFW29_12385 [Solirubrobacteraceae bacterium]|nr:hypothetical protein [Solirubrobacteraceae bacterium]